MAIKSKRPCKKIGCKNLAIYPNKYCSIHKELELKEIEERNKIYDKNIRKKRDKKYTRFYHSKEWKKIREFRLSMDYGLCQQCLKENKTTLADVVHHKIEIKDDWSKRLDVKNLISLCHDCHNKIHKNIPPLKGK